MRCFVAVNVGAGIAEKLSAEVPALKSAAEACGLRVSWGLQESWHATLKFLGELDDARLDVVRARLRALHDLEPFPVEATGIMTLPDGSRSPNVIAVRLSDDGRFSTLAAVIDDAMAAEGFEREARRFVPHLTLGRVRAPRGWRRFAREIEPLARKSFGQGEIRTMALYRSHLGTGPVRYEALETFALGPQGAVSPRPAPVSTGKNVEN
jgi:2'-5' RNA ligase